MNHPKPRDLPLQLELGSIPGAAGQDNAVYALLNPAAKPHLRTPSAWVVKVSHAKTARQDVQRAADARQAAARGLMYKKNKYELLRHFLGEFIPDSFFVLAKASPGKIGERYAELTIQRRLPQCTLADLTERQRNDPRLEAHMRTLLCRLSGAFALLRHVNEYVPPRGCVDMYLDLGDISDAARNHIPPVEAFGSQDVGHLIRTSTTPNLLVDPATMQPYCIDFGQGQWLPEMDETKQLLLQAAPHLGSVVLAAQT